MIYPAFLLFFDTANDRRRIKNILAEREFNYKFVVMDCGVKDDTIILKKGSYRLEEMTGVFITYHKYQEVVCE